ncbi:MAG: hypothetical protein IPH91_05250 [Elusimicrobia bacterium]|nr:hypothetical protein [Elusimicrobiota bacterium]
MPYGAHAREENGRLVLDGLVISVDGRESVRGRREGDPARAGALGAELARELIERGALAIIETLAK